MVKSILKLFLSLAGLAPVLANPAVGATHRVPESYLTIAEGLGAAAQGDTVLVATGTYREHDLILPSGVVLRGATGDPADVVIDGERAGRCLYGADLNATTRLEALTLANGLPAWGDTPHNTWGGGMFIDGGSLTVVACIFRTNEAAIGGGAYVRGQGSLLFEDCLFDGNEASEDAGMLVTGICDPVIRRCTFTGGDRSMMGGGLGIVVSGIALVEDCAITDNKVLETGGGLEIYGSGAVVTVRNCVISGNWARYGGGGLFVGNHGRTILEQCTITGNSAGDYGGGIHVGFNSELEGNQTTILGNNAPSGPDGTTAASATVFLSCCDVDPDFWEPLGPLTLSYEGCAITTEATSWGNLKSLFR